MIKTKIQLLTGDAEALCKLIRRIDFKDIVTAMDNEQEAYEAKAALNQLLVKINRELVNNG